MFKEFVMDNFFYLHPGYTTFNTIIFGLILGIIILGIIKIFDKINKDPLDLIYPLIPIILFGSTSRALVDNHIYPRIHLLATPGIYIFIGILTILLLIISIMIEKRANIQYSTVITIFGSITTIPNIILIIIHGINFGATLLELGLWIIISGIFVLLRNNIETLKNRGNLEVLSAHIFDATSTFVAMEFFGYYEQHVLPTFLINLSGTALIMYPLKIGVILLVLYIIDKEVNEETSNHMLKLAVYILGLAPGIRNFTTLILSFA
ncbi:MAG: DUF63 family protein [Methanosphaera stadtmanae]|nr:DUF63 family protein [Methanosphaera stadtmanae]